MPVSHPEPVWDPGYVVSKKPAPSGLFSTGYDERMPLMKVIYLQFHSLRPFREGRTREQRATAALGD